MHPPRPAITRPSLADDLHEHALAPPAVEFAIEDLFPRTEIEPSLGDGDDYLSPHDLAFQVGIRVVLARAVMMVLGGRSVRGELL